MNFFLPTVNLLQIGFLISALSIFGACTSKTESGLTTIKIAYPSSGTIVNAQVGLIFERTDILKNNGFEGQMKPMPTGRELKMALVAGEVDLILTSEANLVVLLSEGFDARAIGSLGSAGRMALVVNEESKYKSLTDLKGKTIATIFGTSLHQPALLWAREAGAELINMNQVGTMMAALKAGKVDAVMTWDPFLEDALNQRLARIVKSEKFDLITVANGKFVNKQPDVVKRLNKAFREAVVYMVENKQKVNGWFSEMSKISVVAIERSSQENKNYFAKDSAAVDLAISASFVKRLEGMSEFLFEQKVIRTKPQVANSILTN